MSNNREAEKRAREEEEKEKRRKGPFGLSLFNSSGRDEENERNGADDVEMQELEVMEVSSDHSRGMYTCMNDNTDTENEIMQGSCSPCAFVALSPRLHSNFSPLDVDLRYRRVGGLNSRTHSAATPMKQKAEKTNEPIHRSD